MQVQQLKKVLDALKPGLVKGTTTISGVPSCVFFGENQIFTFNGDMAIVSNLNLPVSPCSVPANLLYNFINKLNPEAEIKITSEQNQIKISSGKNRSGIQYSAPLPYRVPEVEQWHPIPNQFLESVRRCIFSISHTENISNPELECVHLTQNFVESCDGFRMTRSNYDELVMPEAYQESGFLIHAENFNKISSAILTHIGYSDQWIHFKDSDGILYCFKIVREEYQNLNEYLEIQGPSIQFPEEIASAVDWADTITDQSIKINRFVSVFVDKDIINIRGEGPDGWAEHTAEIEYQGFPIRFHVNPEFIKEMTKLTNTVTISNDATALKVKGENFVHILALARN